MSTSPEPLRIALIGAGQQGGALLEYCARMPGVRVVAVCDIWEYQRERVRGWLRRYRQEASAYEDYRELLAKEKGLDAVLIATPDWMHAAQTIACLRAGLHVYCEPEMACSVEDARRMVLAARESGRLLQVGRQRRSNPRIRHAIETLLREKDLLGRLTHGWAQWHRPVQAELGWPRKHEIPQDTLERHGYGSMRELVNWRLFHKYSAGLAAQLSSHQLDLFLWAFGVNPSALMAMGGVDFYQRRECDDNVACIFDFPTARGMARAWTQALTTTSCGGFWEAITGDEIWIGTSESRCRNEVQIEFGRPYRGRLTLLEKTGSLRFFSGHGSWPMRSAVRPSGYDLWIADILLRRGVSAGVVVTVHCTECHAVDCYDYAPRIDLHTPSLQAHVENFFSAVRGGAALHCPGEVGYRTAVAVLKVREALAAERRLDFRPEEFAV